MNIEQRISEVGAEIKNYHSGKDYPEIEVTKEDRIYLPILFENYSSKVSEFTAIAQYVFSHFTIGEGKDQSDLAQEIAEAFINIAVIEMFHLEIFGEAIAKLGNYPMFVNSKKRDWKSHFVPYGTTIKNHLELAIKSENEAIVQFKNSMKLINNKSINDVISIIIEDEEKHIQIFTELYNKIA